MDIIEKIQKSSLKILVVGDIMLDRFIFGNVERISPEAPVPVVQSIKEKYSLGGCGNVLRNLVNLGIEGSLISCIGKDQAGEKIIANCKKKGFSFENLIQSEAIQTTEKMRIVAEGQQLVRVDWESSNLKDKDLNNVIKKINKKIEHVNGIIISDYDKGLCDKIVLKFITSKAKELDIPVFIDPKGKKWDKYFGSSCITPNLKEAEDALGKTLRSNEDIENAGIEICNSLNLDSCLITRGAQGMSYISDSLKIHVSSEAKEIYDVCGAGDTVIASFASCITAGICPEIATRFANKAAGIVVSHIGTTAIDISELND